VLVKLLLDENLSPAAAIALAAEGIDAWHVRDRGLQRMSDRKLLERAYAEDRVLVTLNVGDFEKLARERDLHAGVVLIERAGLLRDEQIELVRKIAAALDENGALINEVLHLAEDGTFSIRAYDSGQCAISVRPLSWKKQTGKRYASAQYGDRWISRTISPSRSKSPAVPVRS
jgi:predicted nuclease of predicted toxin-antitoxin system